MRRLLMGIMIVMTALTVFVGCGDKDSKENTDSSQDTNTVEYYQEKLSGTFVGSNDTTYTFSDGKITQQTENNGETVEKSGSYNITETDADGDGENESIALRIIISGQTSSYTLSKEGDNIVLTEGSKKTVLTKK